MFQSQRDAEITIGIYKRVPVLWRDEPEENPWGLSFLRMFDMANDSGMFRTREQLDTRRLETDMATSSFVAADGCFLSTKPS